MRATTWRKAAAVPFHDSTSPSTVYDWANSNHLRFAEETSDLILHQRSPQHRTGARPRVGILLQQLRHKAAHAGAIPVCVATVAGVENQTSDTRSESSGAHSNMVFRALS